MQTSINLKAIKLNKQKHNLPLQNRSSSFHYWVMELQFRFSHQPVASEQEAHFHLPEFDIPEAAPPRRLPKALWVKELEVEPALSTTGSTKANSLSSSHSSNIIILWWTAAVFQHCQHNILNKNIVRIFNNALIVNDANTGKRERYDCSKKSPAIVACILC